MERERVREFLTILQYRSAAIFGFLTPLLTLLYRHKDTRYATVPPLVVLGSVLLLVGLYRVRDHLSILMRRQKEFVLLGSGILLSELVTFFLHDVHFGPLYLLARIGFMIIVVAVLLNVVDRQSGIEAFHAFVAGVLILCVLTILHGFGVFSLPVAMYRLAYRSFFGIRFPVRRTVGIAMSFGEFGIIANFALAYLLFQAFSSDSRRKWLFVAAILVVVMGILISQTRSVFLGTVVTLGVGSLAAYLFERSPDEAGLKRKSKYLFVASVAIIGLVFALTLWPALGNFEVVDVQTSASHKNVVNRVAKNWYALKMIAAHPLLGAGHYAFRHEVGSLLHHHFLEQFVATGVVGGAIYVAFLLALMGTAWKMCISSPDGTQRRLAGALWIGILSAITIWQWFPGFLVESVAFASGLILALREVGPA